MQAVDVRRALGRALPVLKLATKVVNTIPTSSDSWPVRVAKVLSLADHALEIMGGDRGRMREMRDRYGLVEYESAMFASLFFATPLRDAFTLYRESVSQHVDLIQAVGPDGERIVFSESNYSGSRIDSGFYMSGGLDFSAIINRLWQSYPDGIYLSITVDPGGWRKDTTVCAVPAVPEDRLSHAARERLAHMVKVHRCFEADGAHRAYLCVGPAGSGKTSFETLFAKAFGGRALKIDAACLPLINVKELGFLVETLRPRFIIVDDLDRAPIADVTARVLFMLERFKVDYKGTTLLLSVNDVTKVDSALLRCGRIDVPVMFSAPPRDEVEQMVRSLLVAHAVPAARATPDVMDLLVSEAYSDAMTHAYIDDLCRRLRHEEPSDVIASVKLLHQLAEMSNAAKAETKAAPDPAPSK